MISQTISMRRRLVLGAAVVLLLAAGCGGSDDEPEAGTQTTTTAGVGDGPVTLPVSVDALPGDFSASFFGYFPQTLSARPGDTVEFTSSFTGEPHTVAFGTVIDQALTAYAALPPSTAVPQEVQSLLAKVPSFYSLTDTRVDVDPQPAAAQPCFLAGGDPPLIEACGGQPDEQPAFDGTQSFYSSGYLPDEARFALQLADDIAPGNYQFMCLVDRTEMTGTITVVEPGAPIASPADVQKQGEAEIEQAIERVRPRAEQVKAMTAPEAAPAGAPPPESEAAPAPGTRAVGSTVNVFPDEITVPAGGAVSWTLNGAHMIAFNAPEDARPLYAFDGEGVVRANKKGALPANSPPRAPGAGPPVVVDGGQFDGMSFRNSGLLVGDGDVSYRLTFTNPGTFQYRCLFHTDMEGTVKVS